MNFRKILEENEAIKDFSNVILTKSDLKAIRDELKVQTHVVFINWSNQNRELINQETELKLEIQTQLVQNLVKSKQNNPIIDLSKCDLDQDFLKCLEIEVRQNVHIGEIFWGQKNEKEFENDGIKTSIGNYLNKNNNEKFQQYPTDYVYCLLANHCCNHRNEALLKKLLDLGWEIYDMLQINDSISILYVNRAARQLVLAFKGLKMDLKYMIENRDRINNVLYSVLGKDLAVESYKAYLHAREADEVSRELGFSLSFTGYSYGAWLAEQCVYFCYQSTKNLDVKAVTFESPGSFEIIAQLSEANAIYKNRSFDDLCKILNIKTYLLSPNFVNTSNKHIGRVYRILESPSIQQQLDEIDEFIKAFLNRIPIEKLRKKLAKWYESAKKDFRKYKFYLNGLRAFFADDLNWILREFNEETGKLRNEDRLFEVLNWPRIEFTLRRENFDNLNMNLKLGEMLFGFLPFSAVVPKQITKIAAIPLDTVINFVIKTLVKTFLPNVVMAVNAILEIIRGNANCHQCLDFYKYDEDILNDQINETVGSAELFRQTEFNMTFKGKYHIRKADLFSDDLINCDPSHIDRLLFELFFNPEKHERSAIYGRFRAIKKLFLVRSKMNGDTQEGRIYSKLNESSESFEIDMIRDRFRRLIKIDELLKEKIRGSRAEIESSHKIIDHHGGPKMKNFVKTDERIFERLDEIIEMNKLVSIFGELGSGKTTLAIQYGYYRKDKQNDWLIQFIRSSSLKFNVIELFRKVFGDYFQLPNDASHQNEVLLIKIFKKLIEMPLLLIIDDVKDKCDIELIVKHLHPTQHKLLLTTRNRKLLDESTGVLSQFGCIETKPFDENSAIKYLKKNEVIKSINEEEEFARIIRQNSMLRGSILPANLEIGARGLKSHRSENPQNLGKFFTNKDNFVYETLDKETPFALYILKCLAYLDGSFIDYDLIKQLFVNPKSDLELSIEYLVRNKFLKKNLDVLDQNEVSYEMLEITQNEIKKMVDENEKNEIIGKLCVVLNRSLTSEVEQMKNEDLRKLEKLNNHVECLLDEEWQTKTTDSSFLNLLSKTELMNIEIFQDADKSKRMLEKIVGFRKTLPELNYPQIANSLIHIGIICQNQKDYNNALIYYLESLVILKESFKRSNSEPDLVTALTDSVNNDIRQLKNNEVHNQANFAKLLQKIDNRLDLNTLLSIDETKLILQKILDIKRQTLPPNHRYISNSLVYQGLITQKEGDSRKARELYLEAIESMHSDRPQIAYVLKYIGMTYYTEGKLNEAFIEFENAYNLLRRIFSENHLDLCLPLTNMGIICEKQENYSKALGYYNEVLEIQKRLLEPDHLDFAKTYDNIGDICYYYKNYQEAFANYERALQIRNLNYLPELVNHPDFAESYIRLGNLARKLDKDEEALEKYSGALEILIKMSDPIKIANVKCNVGLIYFKQNNYQDALELYWEILACKLSLLPEEHKDIADIYNNLGCVYYKMGNYNDALEYYEKSLAIRKRLGRQTDVEESKQNIDIVILKITEENQLNNR